MSFGQEVKDFAAGFKTTSSAINDARRTKAYEEQVDKYGDKNNTWDLGQTQDPVTGKYWNGADQPPGKKRHSGIHNVGRFLGLTTDERDSSTSAVPTLPGQVISPAQNRDTSSVDDYDENLGYSGGGAVRPVRRYALGGPVLPEEDDTTADPVAPTPAAPAPAPRQALPVQTASAEPAPAPAAPTDSGSAPPDALHAGIMTLQKHFGLDRPEPAVGIDHEKMAGQKALMNSIGRPSDQDMDDAAKAVGVDRHLDKAKSNLRIMEQGYEWYLGHGEVDKANNFAASIIQYSTYEAGKFGTAALDDLRRGDIKSAAAHAAAGYDALPNGFHVTQQVNDDGTVTVGKVDTKTGETSSEHTLTPQQLYQAALSLTNKSGSWGALIEAASERRGLQKAPAQLSDADIGAISSVNGMNSDGSPAAPAIGKTPPSNAAPSINDVGDNPTVLAGSANQAIQQMPEYQRDYAATMAAKESSGDPTKINSSGHAGLFQFDLATWKKATGETIDPKVVGTKDDPRFNPIKAADAMRAATAQNETAFKKKFNRDPTPAELAVMHQQGTTGGLRLIAADSDDPAKRYLRSAALTQNGIPANATAGEALQSIKNYYFGSNGGSAPMGATQVSTTMQDGSRIGDPLAINPALDEDKSEPAPAYSAPAQPQWKHPDATKLAAMTPEGRKIYMQQIRESNLEMQKQFQSDQTESQKKFQADTTAHTAALKAARADATKPIPTKDRIDVIDKLNAAEDKPEVKKMFAADSGKPVAGKPKLEDVRPIAYEIFSRNDVPDTTAYQLASNLVDPTSRGFKIHKTDNGVYRLVTSQGKFTLTPNGYSQIAAIRGQLRAEAVKAGQASATTSARHSNTLAKGKDALAATGDIAKNAVNDNLGGDLNKPSRLPDVLAHPVDTVKGLGRSALNTLDAGFVSRANRR